MALVLAAAIVWALTPRPTGPVVAGGLLIMSVFAFGGTLTEMTDASVWVYFKLKRQGVECKSCKAINRIYPWST